MMLALVPQTAGVVYANNGDPAMVAGTSVLQTDANTTGMQTLVYGGRTWQVIAYDGKNGSGEAITYTNSEGATENLYREGTATLLHQDASSYSIFNSETGHDDDNAYAGSVPESYIADWYNGFTTAEQFAVVKRTLTGGSTDYGSAGYDSNRVKGESVEAFLWLLSEAEVNAVAESARRTSVPAWWTRSPGENSQNEAYVDENGSVEPDGYISQGGGVRPAFDLNLSDVLFTSAAENGKISGDTGAGALTKVGVNTGDTWKVTVEAGHDSFAVDTGNVVYDDTEKAVQVPYYGAVTGDNEYISAVIVSDAGNIVYYGRVAQASAEKGTVSINLKDKISEGDTLYVFNEQFNGDKDGDTPARTDSASAMTAIPLVQDETPELSEGEVGVLKVDIADGSALKGALLQIIDSGNIVDEWTSTEEVHMKTELEVNKEYTLHEETPPEGYVAAADATFRIDEKGNVTSSGAVTGDGVLVVLNQKTKVFVMKVDSADSSAVEGAELQILDGEDIVDEWTSSEEAHQTEGLKAGVEYTLHEKEAPKGYKAAVDTTFSLD